MNDSRPASLDGDFRPRRKLVEFDPKVSTGTLLQMLLILVGMITAYGAYTADKTANNLRVTQIEKDADTNRAAVKESLTELRGDVKELSRAVEKVNRSLDVLNAVNDAKRGGK